MSATIESKSSANSYRQQPFNRDDDMHFHDHDPPNSELTVEARFQSLSAAALLQWAADRFGESLAVSTSFGIQSAVTLELTTRVFPEVPVIWIDTGYLPPETYRYADELASRLKLNLHVYQAEISPSRMEALHGRLWETGDVSDFQRYDDIRKVEPMARALEELQPQALVSGLRAQQTDFRKTLSRVSSDGIRHKVLPILQWTARDVYQFMRENDLPQHPLFEQGYSTVGDGHSSRPTSAEDVDDRDTRFNGLKQECGLHLQNVA
ncbi:MAG: phosphoadenosine phosphosulfate reductase [Pirellulaceae bacterium]|jgi:phosphoadenosine phosphosulfate reductase